jgi:hypothetical protein
MPLLDRQRTGREVGRIRIGITVIGKNDKKRPAKLGTFRFTSGSRIAIATIADLFGGQAREWADRPGQYEVITDAREIPVAVPPGEAFISQDYELWTGGGCARRCDGRIARLYAGGGEQARECVCPPDLGDRMMAAADGNACKPTTRLNVIIPDVEGLGVWRLESHGNYAADELAGTAELMAKAREHGVVIPAMLRLEERQGARRPGREPHKFVVPVLEPLVNLRQLASGQLPAGGLAAMLPPAPAGAKALTAGPTAPPPPPVERPAGPPDASSDDGVVDAELVEDDAADQAAQRTAEHARTLLGPGAVAAVRRSSVELLDRTVVVDGQPTTLRAHLDAVEADLQAVTT